MFSFYEKLYYRLYTIHDVIESTVNPEWMAILSISTHIFLNIESMRILIMIICGEPTLTKMIIFWDQYITILNFVLVYISLGIINFLFFFIHRRYKKIINKYNKEPEKMKKRGKIYIIIYIIGTWVVYGFSLISLAIIRSNVN